MMRRIAAMAWKESIHIRRDMRTLYIAILMPVIMILLFGYAVDFDVDKIQVAIHDMSHTAASRDFESRLTAAGWFRVVRYVQDQRELEELLDHGEVKVGITIPADYSLSLHRGEEATLGAILDGSNNNTATVVSNYLQLFIADYNERRLHDYSARTGIVLTPTVTPSVRILFNPGLKSRFFILPGIIALIMAILSALLTSLTVAREWERGSMEQLISTPVRPVEIIVGKMIPYIGVSFLQVNLAAGLAVFLFGIPFRGGLIPLYLSSLLFSVGALGLGVMLSSVLKSQLPAMQLSILTSMLPGVFLSNFVFPIDSMPVVVRMITYIVPAKYYLVMLRTIFLKGSGFEAYAYETLFLVIYSLIVVAAATKRMVKRIA